MASYDMAWVTDFLAVGHAPMSYQELDAIRSQGIDSIVNLCGEYCDLHQIESDFGFDVYYLPVDDDCAPTMAELEKALDWVDAAVYLGKKVLVHCRMGIGRTGTFVTAYFLRRGFGLKLAKKQLGATRSHFTSFDQWRRLRKYEKKAGKLTVCQPSLDGSRPIDLGPYFAQYERLVQEVEEYTTAVERQVEQLLYCGRETDACCSRFLRLQFVEAAYLSHQLNRVLRQRERAEAIQRALEAQARYCAERDGGDDNGDRVPGRCHEAAGPADASAPQLSYRCPLSVGGKCIVFPYRPIACRLYTVPPLMEGERTGGGSSRGGPGEVLIAPDPHRLNEELHELSGKLLLALSGRRIEDRSLLSPLTHVVAGKFVEDYFRLLAEAACAR